jgi:Glycosyltransferase family 87
MNRDRSLTPFSIRFVLAAAALVALSLASAKGHGSYSSAAIVWALLALGAAVAACGRRAGEPARALDWLGPVALAGVVLGLAPQCWISDWNCVWMPLLIVPGLLFLAVQAVRGELRTPSLPLAVLAAAALLLSGRAVAYTKDLLAEDQTIALFVIRAAAGAGFLLIAAQVGLDLGATGEQGPGFRLRLFLLFAAGAILRIAAVVAWPEPSIDVYTWLRDAPRALLAGRNPYTTEYILNTEVAAYPPLPIVLTVPFSAVGLDVRYANVAGDLAAALVLYLFGRRQGRHLLGALAAGAYLNLPGVPFMLQNAWFEPMLAALLGSGLLLADRGWWGGNLLLGVGLTGKQFGLPMLVPVWRARRGRQGMLLLGIGLATALVILPFFLWSPAAFVHVVLTLHLAIWPDIQSLTVRSAAYHLFGLTVPGWLTAAVTLLLIGWVSWRIPNKESATGLWMGTVLLVFSLLYVKGYFNYFYLCNYLFLLGLAALKPEGEALRIRQQVPAPRECHRASA